MAWTIAGLSGAKRSLSDPNTRKPKTSFYLSVVLGRLMHLWLLDDPAQVRPIFTLPPQRLGVFLSGKSVFLLRILIRRLALQLPTALQIDPDRAMLFHEGGVKEFKLLNDRAAYKGLFEDHLSRIWALIDSNEELKEPAPMFRQGFFFVVQTAPPSPESQKWTTTVRTEDFYMKPWPFVKVIQA